MSIHGPLYKRASRGGRLQLRWFEIRTHYLAYKVNKSDVTFGGGVDLRDSHSTVELLENGTLLRVVGLAMDAEQSEGGRRHRTMNLSAASKLENVPTLENWYKALQRCQVDMRNAEKLDASTQSEPPNLVQSRERNVDEATTRVDAQHVQTFSQVR